MSWDGASAENELQEAVDALVLKGAQITRHRKEKKPKLRLCKPRNNFASGGCYKTSAQPRSVLRKVGHVKDIELSRSERKITPRNVLSLFWAPLSVATLNARASPKKTVLARSSGPQVRVQMQNGPCLESTSPSFSSTPHNERSGDSNSLLHGEAPPEKDEKKDINISDMKLEDNSSKTAAVIEAMTTTVCEKAELEKSTDDSSYKERIVQEPVVAATMQELAVDGQSEHGEAKNTSKDSVQKKSGTMKAVLQSSKSSSCKFLSSARFKEKVKAVPSATTVSPHYLGTLKVLEDKHLQKSCTEFDKADSLRAAVFQNWMEKKRAFLLELKRTEKKKAEELRNDTEKKEAVKREEANASYNAWKAMKAREAKKLNEKKKLEKLKEKEAAEQNAERAKAAQKAFEKWKEKKIEYLREQGRQEEQSERIRKKKEEELAAEKKRDSISAVEKWNGKKKEYMKQKKAEKILERRKKEIQQAEKDEKDKMAREEYEKWLGNIKRREQLKKKQKNLQAVHRSEVSFPWIPPGKVTYAKNY